MKKKKYIKYDPNKSYPTGEDIFYECLKCHTASVSVPDESWSCKCGNVMLDIDYGRLSVKDQSLFTIYKSETDMP